MSADTMTVRVMQEKDIPALVEIDAIASGSPRSDYVQGKARQALSTQHSMVVSLVAEAGGNVVGFIMGQVFLGEYGTPESVATVDTVGVHPEHQKTGVARLLIGEFANHIKKAGVERIRTQVEWNQWDLMGFFRGVGFAPAPGIILERSV